MCKFFGLMAIALVLVVPLSLTPAAGSSLSKKTFNWVKKNPKDIPEPLRNGHAIAYDSNRKVVVLFGGRRTGRPVYMNDTWEWDGNNWTKKEPKTKPPGRYYFAMVYDANRKRVVLFGGNNTGGEKSGFGDTWEYDGNDWIRMKPKISPPGRFCFAMTYDSNRKVTVLFGGWTGTHDVNETSNDHWEWDGINWREIISKNRPPARNYHALSYDSDRKVVVLFGGYFGRKWADNDHVFENDIWEWDGKDWVEKNPAASPVGKYAASMVYDSFQRKTILFGGLERSYETGIWMNDTWTWDGINWIKESPSVSPPRRNHHYLAYDSDRRVVVVFGGWLPPGGGLDDTWEYGETK